MNDIRKAYIEIEFDDTKANERDIGSIDFLDSKFKKLNKDGIKTYGIFIADEDEDDLNAAYINYVANWCFNNSGNHVVTNPLKPFGSWIDDYFKSINKKNDVWLEGYWVAKQYLIENLGNAPNTAFGNRCSPFCLLYRDNKDLFICAAIEEKKVGLREDEWHYDLFVTDNKGTVGEYYSTDSLSEEELERILERLFFEFKNRQFFCHKHKNIKSVFSKIAILSPDEDIIVDEEDNIVTFHTLQEGYAWMRKHGYGYIDFYDLQPLYTVGICKRCGNYLFQSLTDDYHSQCFCCNEDFYSFEQETEN